MQKLQFGLIPLVAALTIPWVPSVAASDTVQCYAGCCGQCSKIKVTVNDGCVSDQESEGQSLCMGVDTSNGLVTYDGITGYPTCESQQDGRCKANSQLLCPTTACPGPAKKSK